jgi:hypothetical protein
MSIRAQSGLVSAGTLDFALRDKASIAESIRRWSECSIDLCGSHGFCLVGQCIVGRLPIGENLQGQAQIQLIIKKPSGYLEFVAVNDVIEQI